MSTPLVSAGAAPLCVRGRTGFLSPGASSDSLTRLQSAKEKEEHEGLCAIMVHRVWLIALNKHYCEPCTWCTATAFQDGTCKEWDFTSCLDRQPQRHPEPLKASVNDNETKRTIPNKTNQHTHQQHSGISPIIQSLRVLDACCESKIPISCTFAGLNCVSIAGSA